MTIEQLKQWTIKNGFNFYAVFNDKDGTPDGVIISTDYNGIYAPAEVYTLHALIRRKAEWAGLRAESAPSRVCLYVYLDPEKRLRELMQVYAEQSRTARA